MAGQVLVASQGISGRMHEIVIDQYTPFLPAA